MRNKAERRISALLAAILLAGCAMTGCGESEVQEANNTSNTASSVTPSADIEAEPETEETQFADNVPELDFGGVTVSMAGQGTENGNNDLDMWVAEMTGDVVHDAIFQRNLTIEDRFNVSFVEPLMNDYTTISVAVKSAVQAGDSAYDFVVNQLAQTSSDVLNGYSMNLNEIPYLDFTMKWYPANVLESAALNNKLYLIVSDMCISYVGQTWSMNFKRIKSR